MNPSFRQKVELKSEYDAIVIGAGLGGLSCAAHLAKEGLTVAVIEQFYNIGGFCQSYKRKGFTLDASVHAIFGAGSMLKIIKELGESVELMPVHDKVVFPKHELLVDTLPQMRADLKVMFPHEADNIDRYYIDLVKTVEDLLLRFRTDDSQKKDLSVQFGSFYKFFGKTTWDVIDSYFKDPELKAVIYSTQTGFMPERAWLFSAYHIYMERNFYHDTSHVRISTQEIPNALANAIVKNGGEIHLKTLVKEIIVEGNRAVGVKLADGRIIKANMGVISDADAKLTFEKMVGLDKIDKKTVHAVTKWITTPSFMVVNLCLDIDIAERGYDGTNLGYYRSYNVCEMYNAMRKGELHDDFWVGISFPTILDPTRAPEGKSIMFLLIPISYGNNNNWGLGQTYSFDGFQAHGEKGETYFQRKDKLAKKIIERVEELIPDLAPHVVYTDVITPVSFETITLNTIGTGLGWLLRPHEMKIDQGLGLPITTSIEGLLLCSSWASLGCGCYATVTTGKIAAYTLLGKDTAKIYQYNWDERYVKDWKIPDEK